MLQYSDMPLVPGVGHGRKVGDIARLVGANIRAYHAARERNDMMSAFEALDAICWTLPDDPHEDPDKAPLKRYQVIIHDDTYRRETKDVYTVQCPECGSIVQYSDDQLGKRAVLPVEYVGRSDIAPQDHLTIMNTWTCPARKCGNVVDTHDLRGRRVLDIHKIEQVEPRRLRVVPRPPLLKDMEGSDATHRWERQMLRWLGKYNVELMAGLAEYRRNMIADGLMEDVGDFGGSGGVT